ncbi:unnamed protein product [Protopolystoma xenopodis]|uniref:PDEase domain-containing protein n=1 Tax=Protopolystoma xenopodis TaxID=117903 RepID=A0A3S5A9N2_9PLAT|nr:unnamed protein product [Protopolystoma xenopodis]
MSKHSDIVAAFQQHLPLLTGCPVVVIPGSDKLTPTSQPHGSDTDQRSIVASTEIVYACSCSLHAAVSEAGDSSTNERPEAGPNILNPTSNVFLRSKGHLTAWQSTDTNCAAGLKGASTGGSCASRLDNAGDLRPVHKAHLGRLLAADTELRLAVMVILMKLADISNESRPLHVAGHWLDRLLEEFSTQVTVLHYSGLFEATAGNGDMGIVHLNRFLKIPLIFIQTY